MASRSPKKFRSDRTTTIFSISSVRGRGKENLVEKKSPGKGVKKRKILFWGDLGVRPSLRVRTGSTRPGKGRRKEETAGE